MNNFRTKLATPESNCDYSVPQNVLEEAIRRNSERTVLPNLTSRHMYVVSVECDVYTLPDIYQFKRR